MAIRSLKSSNENNLFILFDNLFDLDSNILIS